MRKTLFLAVALLSANNVNAAEYTVESYTTDALVEAIGLCTSTDAASPDVIHFNILNDEIMITSQVALGAKSIIIDGYNKNTGNYVTLNCKESSNGRVFSNGAGANIIIKNLRVKNCNNIAWPMTAGNNTNITLINCEFSDNVGKDGNSNNGGVIRMNGVNLKIDGCYFSNNSCGGNYGGGAICVYGNKSYNTSIEIENSSFVNNTNSETSAAGGGAVCIYSTASTKAFTSAKIINSTFSGNYCAYRGGAIYLRNANTAETLSPVLINNTIVGNSTINSGGGVCIFAAANTKIDAALINNLVTNNAISSVNDFGWWYLGDRVSISAYNNIVTESGAFFTNFVDVENPNGNQQITDMAQIYKNVEEKEIGSTTLALPALEGDGCKVATLCVGSKASGAGIATVEGYEIPTVDAAKIARPEVPSVGAVEIGSVPSGVENIESEATIVKENNNLIINYKNAGLLQVFNMKGQLVITAPVEGNSKVSIDGLSRGIYVARIENACFKFYK